MARVWRESLAAVLSVLLRFRHTLYDKRIFKSYEAEKATLCIGNLAVGGTGKSPLVAWLMEHYATRYKAVMLSRGYGRKTHGFRVVQATSSYREVGDEPLQLERRSNDFRVVVCEDRVRGCREIAQRFPDTRLIILDDAFQHRRLLPTLNILLTRYDNPYSRDRLFPVGRLRDLPSQAKRTHAIVITNIPAEATREECEQLATELQTSERQVILYSAVRYGALTDMSGQKCSLLKVGDSVVPIVGIANPEPFIAYIRSQVGDTALMTPLCFKDHYAYTPANIRTLEDLAQQALVVTTEKDMARLRELISPDSILRERLFYIPIEISWLWDSEQKMEKLLNGVFEANCRTSSLFFA